MFKRFLYDFARALQRAAPSKNELLLLAGVALGTRFFWEVWRPAVWAFPALWLILWGLGIWLPPDKGGGT